VRVEAAASLAKLLPNDTASILVLAESLARDKDWSRHEAAKYLYDLGPRAAPATPALANLVKSGRYQPHMIDEVWYAVHALARIGPAAKDALPVLLDRLDRDSANPHWSSSTTNYVPAGDNIFAYTVARIGPAALPELLKLVEAKDDPNAKAALSGSGSFALGSGPVHTALLAAHERAAKRRRAAVIAIGFMGPPAKDALPALEALRKKLDDEEASSEDWLIKALDRAIARIRDPKALPIEQLADR
jgi:hypothetical protein